MSRCDREVACLASDHQGWNFETSVWRAVSSHSSHRPQDILLAKSSLYVHKGGLKPHSFHFTELLGQNIKTKGVCVITVFQETSLIFIDPNYSVYSRYTRWWGYQRYACLMGNMQVYIGLKYLCELIRSSRTHFGESNKTHFSLIQ